MSLFIWCYAICNWKLGSLFGLIIIISLYIYSLSVFFVSHTFPFQSSLQTENDDLRRQRVMQASEGERLKEQLRNLEDQLVCMCLCDAWRNKRCPEELGMRVCVL